MYHLENQTAVVVGAASGIGKACAIRLAAEGAAVVCADLNFDGLLQTVDEIKDSGGTAKAVKVDLTSIDSINNLVSEAVASFGHIHILVNVAGVCQSKPLLDVTEKDWDFIVDINQKGTVFCLQKIAKQMVDQVPDSVKNAKKSTHCYGKIVLCSSISGRRGRELQVHYAASKAAIISITQSAALAFAPFGINVNAISPSVVKTPMWEKNVQEKSLAFNKDVLKETEDFINRIPLKRAGTVEEMANAVAFLCSKESDYITGQTLNVDGGFEMN
ncbi:glucose 1-dehydrogenase [Treponema sp. OMZ 840]|uniref:SDR family NAD(P)-dependent oxidoreductase n=1 Tax=Treponema sp. OMZ 840 TaxID=244313 RepID=UPI003D90AC61